MNLSQKKMQSASKKITVILKLGFTVCIIIEILALMAIGILIFSGENVKSSFLTAFDVTANNGTTISLAPQSLLVMFLLSLVDALLISAVIILIHAIFNDMKRGSTPFLRRNTMRIKGVAIIAIILSIIGSYSDALVDYYTIGELTWKVNAAGLIIGMVVYCISFIFDYGCDLQQESDETL